LIQIRIYLKVTFFFIEDSNLFRPGSWKYCFYFSK